MNEIIQNFHKDIDKAKDMLSPVICNFCNEMYDLTCVKVIHRYGDCTLFKTPCCNKNADDRAWKGMPDFKEVNTENLINKTFNYYGKNT